jgi:hypothetical protein
MRPRPPEIGEALNAESLAGETHEGFRTSDLDKRLQRYGSAHADTIKYSRYLADQGEIRLSEKLAECGNYLVLHDYYSIGQTRLAKIHTCQKHLLCPLCAIRRSAKAVRVYLEKFLHLHHADPTLKGYLVTYTVKDGPDLVERQSHLESSLRRYHKYRHLDRGHEITKAKAAIWAYEVKRGKNSGLWHPHVHAVLLCHEAPDMYKMQREWKDITGDSIMVHVRPLDELDPVRAFLEVCKYPLKFSDMTDRDRLDAFRILKGKRLQGSFGAFRGLDIDPGDSDELLVDMPYIVRVCNYYEGQGYVSQTTGEIHNLPKEAA